MNNNFIRFSVFQKLLVLSICILIGNAFIGFSIYNRNKKLINSEHWIHHTEQIIQESESILSLGKDIENSATGFVITKDTALLSPMYNAEKLAFKHIRHLRLLTEDDLTQQNKVDS